MRKTALAAPLVAAVLALLTACGGNGPGPAGPDASQTTAATPSGTAGATATGGATPTEDDLAFTVDGVGPYQLGVTLDSLEEVGLLDEIGTGGETCAANTRARGTDVFTDVRMSFRPDGLLYLVTNRSEAIATPSGATLGSTMAELNTIYASATHEELGDGFYAAFLVRAGAAGRGILFDLGTDDEVFTMTAGDANYLRDSYVNGTDFC
jgi:hypothetical protein